MRCIRAVFAVMQCLSGPKISQNVNYTQRGTMEGPKAPSEARRREAPECLGRWGLGRGAVAPPSMGVWGHCLRKFWNLTVQICSFFPRFQDRDSSPIRCFSFIYCLHLFIVDHPVVFRKVNTVKQNSEISQSNNQHTGKRFWDRLRETIKKFYGFP